MRLSLFAIALMLASVSVLAEESASDGQSSETSISPDEQPAELTIDDLFRSSAIRNPVLSPDGEYVAYFRYGTLVIGKPGSGYFDIRTFHSRLSIEDLNWIGPHAVWVQSWDSPNNQYFGTAVRFNDLGEEGLKVDLVWDHRNPGYVSDFLASEDSYVVLARPQFENDTLTSKLYRIDVFRGIDDQLIAQNRIDTGPEDFFYYQKNTDGDYVLGIRLVEGVPEIWTRAPEQEAWTLVWTADKESTFIPWQISDDAKTLWVLTDARTDRIVAAEFDLESHQLTNVLFEHERVDVDAILMSKDTNKPIGVIYLEQGLLRYRYFSDEHGLEFERLRGQFPDQGVMIVGTAAGTDARLVFVSSPTSRGGIHVCYLDQDKCTLVKSVAPWLEGKSLNKTVPMTVQSTDGIVVDAFLTLPADTDDRVPLVALPHGGPIGISDDRYFSPDVQWLAHNGYAVLQVNYRGSGGYGSQFQEAGLRQWGRGIEDDIEAAVQFAIGEFPRIDRERVGIYGASYGGYSALMSVIRNPDLFKCAASFAGVTDLTFLFSDSRALRSEALRETLIDYIGDPDVDYAEQMENSPVYRYRDIQRPVLLAHGMDDTVVDFEHSWRLQKMIRLSGTAPEFILLKGVGHGFEYISEAKELYDPLVRFLDTHLKANGVSRTSN